MSVTRIAARYAKPLLELAEEKKALDAVYKDMNSLLDICKSNREFELMLKSPIISHLKKAAVLEAIFGKKVDKISATFLQLVTKKEREKFLPEIAREFVKMYNTKKGFQEATVTTAYKLDDSTLKSFEKLVTDISRSKPLLTQKIDRELVGGYVLKLGDQQIDESISGQLKDLKLKFQNEKV